MKTTLSAFLPCALLGLCLLAHPLPAADTPPPPAPDPVEGKWLGTAGDPENRAVFGLDIKRDAKGELSGSLYLDLLNFYGAPLPSFHAAGSGKFTVPEFGLELTLAGDRLTGTLGGKAPVELKRTTGALPVDLPLPDDLSRGPGPRWRAKLGGAIYAPAALHDGLAYVGATNGVFTALKLADGSVAWIFAAGRPIFGEALVTDDAVYFGCDNGRLYRLNRADGKEVWHYELGDAQVSRILPDPNDQSEENYDYKGAAPVLADGNLYLGSGDGSFHAVKAATGERVWRIESKGRIRTTAVVHGPNLIFGTLGGLICMVERATGKEVWKFDAKLPVTSAPAIIGDRLVIGTRGSALYGINLANGERFWRVSFWGSWVESTAVSGGDGLAYVGSSDNRRVMCFDPKDGRIAWRTDVFGSPWGRPVVTGKFVYAGAIGTAPYSIRHTGGVIALDRQTGRLAWRWPLPNPPGTFNYGFAASPALAGGLLVIGGLDGTLYAFPAE